MPTVDSTVGFLCIHPVGSRGVLVFGNGIRSSVCLHQTKTMKAILEFNLPEDQDDHAYALAGIDALLTIEDVLTEIRSAIRHECGELKTYVDEDSGETKPCDLDTLWAVMQFICKVKEQRRLPELI